MLSRILWISVAGIALVAGIAIQDGGSISEWHARAHALAESDRVDDQADRASERSFDKLQVTGRDGQEIDVPAEAKRAMAEAVGRLVKAEAHLAVVRIGDGNDAELQAANARRDQARADVDRLKAAIKGFERGAQTESNALREQIKREIREDIRASIRDAVRS
ncbi:MAG: hypothetical protein M3Q19_06545 [Pseudomonadota bacterium]|nr:hypothetical protein [Pseudomonadota bacterium]